MALLQQLPAHHGVLRVFATHGLPDRIALVDWVLTGPFLMQKFEFNDHLRGIALREAYRRQERNEQLGRKGRNGGAETGALALQKHLLGAAAELAVAVHLGMQDHVFKDKDPVRGSCDLPGNIDVKCRPNHDWDLLVQLDDTPGKTYVLVTIKSKKVLIHGWIQWSEMRREWIKEYSPGRPCYCVPQEYLHDMETLKCQADVA
jgi:hypothetical protein